MTARIRIVVHNLAQAEAALRAAAEQGRAIVIESAPGAARYLGAPYWLAMIEAAAKSVPEAKFEALLECGGAYGLALDALRRGAKAIRVAGRKDVLARVADIARQSGARLERGPARPGALDLGEARDPLAAARAFLARRRR